MINRVYFEYTSAVSSLKYFIMSIVVGVLMSQNLKDDEQESFYSSMKFYIIQAATFILMILFHSLSKRLKFLFIIKFSFFQV
jgi:hypothetical protein